MVSSEKTGAPVRYGAACEAETKTVDPAVISTGSPAGIEWVVGGRGDEYELELVVQPNGSTYYLVH